MKIKSDLSFRLIWSVLAIFLIVALGADFMANEKPFFHDDGIDKTWPIFQGDQVQIDWKSMSGRLVFAPIPFSPHHTNLSNRYRPPMSTIKIGKRTYRHWLGTDRLGRDVASGMIHGCRKSIVVGLLAMFLAMIIGILAGCIAGYFGNYSMKISKWLVVVTCVLGFYLIYLVSYVGLSASVALFIWLLTLGMGTSLSKSTAETWPIPFDALLLRVVEVLASIPTLLFLMALSAIFVSPSLSILAMIIAFLRWPRFAMFMRSEVQKIKERNHITAAKISGMSDPQILMKFILPEAITPIIILFAFGVASTILLESTLSFLGIGVPIDTVTWGSILGQSRANIAAWWLAVYPGLAIFLIITCLNLLGDLMRARLNPGL